MSSLLKTVWWGMRLASLRTHLFLWWLLVLLIVEESFVVEDIFVSVYQMCIPKEEVSVQICEFSYLSTAGILERYIPSIRVQSVA